MSKRNGCAASMVTCFRRANSSPRFMCSASSRSGRSSTTFRIIRVCRRVSAAQTKRLGGRARASSSPPKVRDLELISDTRADLGQARVDVGAEARVRDVLDIGDNIPVLVELVAEAARLAEIPAAACVDAVRFVPQRRGVDRGAKLALEEKPFVDRNAPSEAGEAVARLAPGIDHRADVDARIEKPAEPLAADVVGVADRIGQELAGYVNRRTLVMNPVMSVNADARLLA